MRTRMKEQARGFSLTEVLLAVATLTVGMMFIGGTYFLGLHYSTLATEKTIGAVVAQEAVNLIRLHGINFDNTEFAEGQVVPYRTLIENPGREDIFTYNNQYRWDALCQLVNKDGNTKRVHVTVLVTRWMGGDQPELRTFSAEVEDGRYLSISSSSGNDEGRPVHRSYIVSDTDVDRVFKLIRSKDESSNAVRWELNPDPNLPANDTLVSHPWTVSTDKDSMTQTRIVFVNKAEIVF